MSVYRDAVNGRVPRALNGTTEFRVRRSKVHPLFDSLQMYLEIEAQVREQTGMTIAVGGADETDAVEQLAQNIRKQYERAVEMEVQTSRTTDIFVFSLSNTQVCTLARALAVAEGVLQDGSVTLIHPASGTVANEEGRRIDPDGYDHTPRPTEDVSELLESTLRSASKWNVPESTYTPF